MEKKVYELKIDEDYKYLIAPLQRREFLQLEENIIADGCREPIVVWNGVIVDGHNRYEICTRHQIPFAIQEMDFECKEAVYAWICSNQLGRRNITEDTRKFLIGRQYEAEKRALKKHRDKVEHGIIPEDTSLPYVPSEDFVYMPGERHNPTASRIARENNVSHGTVEKYAIYSRAIDEIADKEPDIVPKILGGKYKISHNNVVELSKLSAEDIKKVGRRIEKMNQPYVQYKNTRGIIPKKNVSGVGEPLPPAPSIKDMPAFDPDAEITGLTLTIPSWGSSIERVRTKSDLTIVSNGARQKLVNALSELAEQIFDMLTDIEEK